MMVNGHGRLNYSPHFSNNMNVAERVPGAPPDLQLAGQGGHQSRGDRGARAHLRPLPRRGRRPRRTQPPQAAAGGPGRLLRGAAAAARAARDRGRGRGHAGAGSAPRPRPAGGRRQPRGVGPGVGAALPRPQRRVRVPGVPSAGGAAGRAAGHAARHQDVRAAAAGPSLARPRAPGDQAGLAAPQRVGAGDRPLQGCVRRLEHFNTRE